MAVLPIVIWPSLILTVRAGRIEGVTAGIRRLADDMLATMYDAGGRGLAAPQVGIAQRLFVMDAGWKSGAPRPLVCVNPELVWRSDVTASGPEGCLSIPGPIVQVNRAQAIRMDWHDLDGRAHSARLAGAAAIIAQHEIDHLDGILTLDHLSPTARARAEAEVAA
ncbi:MAG: peptide deformylase [Paracoccaceae bacterium]